jgi:methyl-accepting chemotaxis protein-2 (aspartate sensor receptor)
MAEEAVGGRPRKGFRRRFQDMTMRTSWMLVLATFLTLLIALSSLGLYLLQRSEKTVSELASHAGEIGVQEQQAFTALAEQARLAFLAILLLAILAAAAVIWGVTRNVIQPLQRVVASFDAMAYGDLSVPVERLGNNEIGQLLNAVAALQQRLARTVSVVRISSDAVLRGAQHIATGNRKFSTRTEQQAMQLRRTAARLDRLSSIVKQNAEHARHARRLAEEAADTANGSHQVVGDLVLTMHEISQGSQHITEVIRVIDALASQTNMLALNAAVEAARAGEQGKGFGAVAAEVHELAGRSAEAAETIRTLVETSVSRIEAGTANADKAAQVMTAVVKAVHHLNELMDEIASASQDQSQGIGQVNAAIAKMDQVTQQNAELIKQEAKAAGQVEAAAERLSKAIAVFKLPDVSKQRPTDPHYDELASWFESLSPEDLVHDFGRKPRSRKQRS